MVDEKKRGKGGIGIVLIWLNCWVVCGSLSVRAAHQYDEPSTAPTGSFEASPMLAGYFVGRSVYVTLAGNASDTDVHINSPGDPPEQWQNVPDTFDAEFAYRWVVTNLADTSPLNLSGKNAYFTTKNGTDTGSVIMKAKDDGVHYQDFDDNTQVASINVTIVDPDGIRIKSQSPGAASPEGPPTWGYTTPVWWQLTYGGEDLPWAARVTERITPIQRCSNASSRTDCNATGSFGDLATWTHENDGGYIDNHYSSYWEPIYVDVPPLSGKYDIAVNKQRFKNTETGSTFGPIFVDYHSVDHSMDFDHDEHELQ